MNYCLLPKKNLILFVFALAFYAHSANIHLGDGVYLLDKSLDPASTVVKVTLSSEQMNDLVRKNTVAPNVLTFQRELWNITKNSIYSKFEDDFDFIYYVLNSTSNGQLGFLGRFIPVRTDHQNVDLYMPNGGNAEDYYEWGSGKRLKGVFYLPKYDAIKNGPALHEFAHYWGVAIHKDVDGHWGASSAGGQLGGFKYLRERSDLGNNKFQGSMRADFSTGFGIGGYSTNAHPYSDIELYLMGFKSAQDLRDANFTLDIYLNNSGTPAPNSEGVFTANQKNSYTIDDLMSNFGGKERYPTAANSQKEFRVLTVLLTLPDTVGQTTFGDRISKTVEDINWFGEKTEHTGGHYNFYQATRGIGSINISGVENSVKSGIDVSRPDPNPQPEKPYEPQPQPANLTVLPVFMNLVEGYADTSFQISISNTGGVREHFDSISVSGNNFVIKRKGGNWVAATATQDSWRFSPVAGLGKGVYTATATVHFSGRDEMSAEINLLVRAANDPEPAPGNLTIDPIVLDFAADYTDTNVVIAIKNSGEINAFVNSLSVSSPSAAGKFSIVFASGSATIAPNYENKTWIMEVKRGLAKGTYDAELTLSYDNGKTFTANVVLNVDTEDDGGGNQTSVRDPNRQDSRYGIFFAQNPVGDKAQIYLRNPEPASARIIIFDNLGNTVHSVETQCLRPELESINPCETVWDLTNNAGRFVASGAYLIVAEARGMSGNVWRYSSKLSVIRQ